VKDLPEIPKWRLERDSNPRPLGRKASSQPTSHLVPRTLLSSYLQGALYKFLNEGMNSINNCTGALPRRRFWVYRLGSCIIMQKRKLGKHT